MNIVNSDRIYLYIKLNACLVPLLLLSATHIVGCEQFEMILM